MSLISEYFPDFSEDVYEKLDQLMVLYKEWNDKVNVISRKDIDNIEVNHIIHSLSLTSFITFNAGSRVLDLGTGGGLPGIPLAICYPETQFLLIDGTKKKIDVVNDIIEKLELKNVKAIQLRAEECKEQFDFVVTRAVASMDKLYRWSQKLILKKGSHALPNGIIALKGGDLKDELAMVKKDTYLEKVSIQEFVDHSYFENKYIVYVQV